MAIVLTPGLHNASVPVTVSPSGRSVQAQIMLTTDPAGVNQATITAKSPTQSSTGSAQTFSFTGASGVNVPSTAATYYPFTAVYVDGVGPYWFPLEALSILGITVGPIVWS